MASQEEIDALPDELTLVLRAPIEFAGQTHGEITLKEPTADQLEEISKHRGVASTCAFIALTAGVPIGVARQLKARDLKRAEDFFESFLQDVQRIGPSG